MATSSLIITRINQLANPAEYTLVTDDRSVVDVGRKKKAPLMSSDKFAQTIELVGDRDAQVEDTGDRELSEAELGEWLDLFRGNLPG